MIDRSVYSSHKRLRVVLVDDHAVVRTGYRLLLENEAYIEVVAELGSGEAAYHRLDELQPDVLITDLSMPGIGGIEAIRRIRAKSQAVKILVFTMHENIAFLEHALEAGANGYITKNSAPNVLVHAVQCVVAGKQYIDPRLVDRLGQQQGDAESFAKLSKREFQIFCKFAEGMGVNELSEALSLSPKTVANYQTRIKEKLGLNSSADLVRLAISKGIVTV